MRQFLVLWTLLSVWGAARGQDRHFVYLQADNEQPFYVTLGGQTRSSTASGYMILSKLKDSSIEFVVGFPMRKYPEYRFRVNRLAKDRGMALKDFGSKGWGLFDFQTFEVTMGESLSEPITEQAPKPILAVRDSFATVLASVIGDSTVMDPALIIRAADVTSPNMGQPVSAADSTAISTAAVASMVPRDSAMQAKTEAAAVKDTALAVLPPAAPSAGADSTAISTAAVASMVLPDSAMQAKTEAAAVKDTALVVLPPAVPSTGADSTAISTAAVASMVLPDSAMQAKTEAVAVKDTALAVLPAVGSSAADSMNASAGLQSSLATSDTLFRPSAPELVNRAPVAIPDSSTGSASSDSVAAARSLPAASQGTLEKMPTASTVATDTASQVVLQSAPAMQKDAKPSILSMTRKLLEFSDSTGYQLVFADNDLSGRFDTVSVWIPALAVRVPSGNVIPVQPEGKPSVRSDCAGMVSATELGQLRRRMESIPDEDAKVAAALREFRYRCFTTEQVRSLLVVFFREEGRLKLLDAAYSRVYDPASFPTLQSVFKDPNMMQRFRKLIGQ